jgi:hypothetical protein
MGKQGRVWFRETLTLAGYLIARAKREQTWYHAETLIMRAARRILRLPMGPLVDRFYYGDIQQSTGIRRRAYQHGVNTIASQVMPLQKLDPGFTADMDLLASKFLLDELFLRNEFQAMARQYASENLHQTVVLVADVGLFPPLEAEGSGLAVRGQRRLQWPHYFLGLAIAPFYLLHLLHRKSAGGQSLPARGQVLCEVDSMPVVDMFRELLEPEYAPLFFIQPHYLQHFSAEQASRLSLHVHGVDPIKCVRLKTLLRNWLRLAVSGAPSLMAGGVLFFDFFKTLAQGILYTPVAKGCTYLTFEHMSTVKAVRNELLRATGNTSVFVPFNAYAIDHYFVPEFRYNYDLLCSPGPLLELVYSMQQAATRTVLQTGAYSPHRKVASDDSAAEERQAQLAAFKGNCVAITILSAGVLPGTLSSEQRLLALARELASHAGVKVFIRQKPVPLEQRYAGFFDCVKNEPAIMLTHAEYKLFDFLPVTDIFVTSNSSSAVDLCGAGGDFFAVDFWNDRDLYLWQTKVDGVFVAQEEATSAIISWVQDDPPGSRARHHQRMDALRSLISYSAGSFEAYRYRLQAQLAPWLGAPKRDAASRMTERVTT